MVDSRLEFVTQMSVFKACH